MADELADDDFDIDVRITPSLPVTQSQGGETQATCYPCPHPDTNYPCPAPDTRYPCSAQCEPDTRFCDPR